MKKIRADWANLPFDLLLLIANRIRFLDDYVSFCLVCNSWRKLLFFKDNDSSLPSLYPMTLLMGKQFGQHEFYNPFNGGGIVKSRLPEIHGKRCWGSSNGWLITLDAEHRIHLFNPFSRLQIQLPKLVPDPNILIKSDFYNKIIVSGDSSSSDFVVFAIYSDHKSHNRKVASIKLGAKSWIPLQRPGEKSYDFLYDAMYFNGKFYMVGRIFVKICNSNGLLLQSLSVAAWICNLTDSKFLQASEITYIVNLGGQICLVTRSSLVGSRKDPVQDTTFRFKVFKLDENTKERSRRCEKLVSLGNWSIFVGSNNSFAISCIEYPECKSNCIYFTDRYPSKNYYPPKKVSSSYDTGVYNYADGTIKLFGEKNSLYLKEDGLPVWVKPFW